jgi:cytochrome P450
MLAAADALIDRIAGRGTGDFIADFALPFPLTVICEMLGVPPADRALLRAWSSGFIVEETDDPASRARAQTEAVAGLGNYFSDLLARRRRDPGSDILSEMIRPHAGEPRLTDSELAGNCILLMVAGHETTVNLLGNGLLLLLRRPEDLARLRGDPSLWPGAIAEMLRFEAPVQRSTFRLTTSPIELGGEMLPAGAQVTALIGAANRDPAVFADPDRFDITRRPNQHLSFGAGPHHCLGAALGRLEARIGFTRLLERLPRLRLAGGAKPGLFGRPAGSPTAPTPPAWRANAVIRGLRRLDVAW